VQLNVRAPGELTANQQNAHETTGRAPMPKRCLRYPGRRRARFFGSYVTDLVSRDVRQISDIERPAEMRRLQLRSVTKHR